MSEDDFSDPYDEPIMEISIETLTGTSFDMRVYPTDTVLDIKNKIQRVEGKWFYLSFLTDSNINSVVIVCDVIIFGTLNFLFL